MHFQPRRIGLYFQQAGLRLILVDQFVQRVALDCVAKFF